MINRDGPLSTRETWDESVDIDQAKVETLLREFDPKIQELNARLQAEGSVPSVDLQREIAALDKEWGYEGHVFFVSGRWMAPNLSIVDGLIEVEHSEAEACHVAYSQGFTMFDKQVGLSFSARTVRFINSRMSGHIAPLYFASPDKVSMQYVRPGGEEIVSTSEEDVKLAIDTASTIYEKMTDKETGRFYAMTVEEQEAFYRSLTAIVDKAMPSPSSLDNIEIANVTTPYYFTASTNNLRVRIVHPVPGTGNVEVGGKVMGVTIPRLMNGSLIDRVEKPSDMSEGDELCLVINPTYMNAIDPEMGDQFAVVPVKYVDLNDLEAS